ncbi:MAG: copper resistance protein CopC [Alphaproteobacteria bacterium]|nr:copper resistance protein CopC [Alphaproteobacteria bacterium]
MHKHRLIAGLAFFSIAGSAQAATIIQTLPYLQYAPRERLVSSDPPAHSLLTQPPEAITLTFSSGLRPDASRIELLSLYGNEIPLDGLTVNAEIMTVKLPPLQPGQYIVKWQTRCACEDNGPVRGEYRFVVQ